MMAKETNSAALAGANMSEVMLLAYKADGNVC